MITFYMISFDPDQATTVSKIQNQQTLKKGNHEIMKRISKPSIVFLVLGFTLDFHQSPQKADL